MRDLYITPSLIRRRYDQGLDSIVRLIADLEDRIEDLTAMQVAAPQKLIRSQKAHIKRLEQTIANKDEELVKAHQLNVQLQSRIRELEKSLEADHPVITEVAIKRDSHNSNQPPSLDLPWTKPKRTRSLRKQSGLKVGGQLGHSGATLHSVAIPNRIVLYSNDECQSCGASLTAVEPSRFFRRQVFEIENGSMSVVEHRASHKICPACGNLSRGQFPLVVKAPGAVWRERIIPRRVSASLSTFAGRTDAGSDARYVRL